MSDVRILRSQEVRERTGLKRTTIHNLVKDGKFPAPINIAGNRSGWYESEILEWMKSRPRKGQRAAACATVPPVAAVIASVPARTTRPKATKKSGAAAVTAPLQTPVNGTASQAELPL